MNPRTTKAYRMEPQDYIHNKLMLHIKYESFYSGHHQGKKSSIVQISQMFANRIPSCSGIGVSSFHRRSTG